MVYRATTWRTIAVGVTLLSIAASACAAPDWSKVLMRKVTLFYPGQASLEWVMNVADHSAVPAIALRKRYCAQCHEGETHEVGADIVAGTPVGSSKSVLEPAPIAGKVGSVPVIIQIAHDDTKIYFRFQWDSPKPVAGKPMDPRNEVKLAVMFDGGGTVNGTEINGCWATCHTDLRTMKDARDDKKTKYIHNPNLAAGKFMDLIQFRSGPGEKPIDGYVDSERHMDGGRSLVAAEGTKQDGKWIVTFERELAGRGKGDHDIVADKIYNFGFAIHEDYAAARYHYVSLGYRFGLDQARPEFRNYINVQR
jgi:hypothetical protein